MSEEQRARKPYPSDLTDAQWAILEPLIPRPKPHVGDAPAKWTCAKC